MDSEDITVTFKLSSGPKFDLKLSPACTVLETKQKAQEQCQILPEHQRLVYRGRILKDTETLESYKIATSHTIHVVKINPPTQAATTTSTTTTETQQATTPSTTPIPITTPTTATPDPANLMSGLLGDSGYNAVMSSESLQELMANPAVTSMMQEVMRNPELLRTMLQANPFLNSMAQSNPMLQTVLSNPELLRAAMNPDTINSMMGLHQYQQGRGNIAGTAAPGTTPPIGDTQGATTVEELIGRTFNMNQATTASVDPATRYQVELQQLEDMGFIDRDANILALQRTGGDINAAISWLLENGQGN